MWYQCLIGKNQIRYKASYQRMKMSACFIFIGLMLITRSYGCSCSVAFSSYITEASANSQSASMTDGAIIKFDETEANEGEGFSTSTGKFTAPFSGVYGFTWTFCVDSRTTDGGPLYYGEYGTKLMSGNSVIGVLHTDTETTKDDACSTGFVIKYISEGTEVYVKNFYAHQGKILSKENHTRTTFSGWKLNQ